MTRFLDKKKSTVLAGRLVAGAVVAAAMIVPVATAQAAVVGQSGSGHPTVAQGATVQYGPYVDQLDCTFDEGMAVGSGVYSWVGKCEKHPVTGYWWFLATYR
jgi:hypothetical protein